MWMWSGKEFLKVLGRFINLYISLYIKKSSIEDIKMPKLYWEFKLDEKNLDELVEQGLDKKKTAELIKQRLSDKGYDVIALPETSEGLPLVMAIGCEGRFTHGVDMRESTQDLNIHYNLVKAYTQ